MIVTRDLRKHFMERPALRFWDVRRIDALRGVDFAAAPGEIVALLGRNGAGKTTLMKILATLIIPTSGAASVGGIDVTADPAGARRLIGLVTGDERSFYWRLTGYANLELFAALNDVPRAEVRGRVEETLKLVGLTNRAHTTFKTWSSGMKQRLALARCLLHDPALLLMDEPARGLDPVIKEEFFRLVRERLSRELGKTILLSTHVIEETAAADRILVLHEGRIIADLPGGSADEAKRILTEAPATE